MTTYDKIKAFEYIHSRMIEWKGDITNNDLSILKSLKLLYLISNISEENHLLDIFNNFKAMPLGPVESDIYTAIKTDQLNLFKITKDKTEFKTESLDISEIDICSETKIKIDKSFNLLKESNPNLIRYSASNLVEITHLRYSWRYFFEKARMNRRSSISMTSDYILSEEKILFL